MIKPRTAKIWEIRRTKYHHGTLVSFPAEAVCQEIQLETKTRMSVSKKFPLWT